MNVTIYCRLYALFRDFSVPLAALIWAVYSWCRDNKRTLSIRQLGDSYSDRISSTPQGIPNFSIELALTNDSPRANIVVAYYSLELPWKDDDVDMIFGPISSLDQPEKFYIIHPESIPVDREKVLNHRRYQYGKLGPGEPFRGYFLARGGSPIPENLRTKERIEALRRDGYKR